MSNVSTSHNVVSFVSGKSEALTGQRLTVAKYKSTAKQAARFGNVCASIPVLTVTEELFLDHPGILGHVSNWLQEKQDAVFKSVYESHGGSLSSVNDAELDIPAIIGFLNAQSVSGRLTKESIEAWYMEECAGIIQVQAAIKKGYIGADSADEELTLSDAQLADITKVSNAYKDLFSGLAGGTTRYSAQIQESLSKMLGFCADSVMTERLSTRLESMKEQKDYADIL